LEGSSTCHHFASIPSACILLVIKENIDAGRNLKLKDQLWSAGIHPNAASKGKRCTFKIFVFLRILPESPRWLLATGRLDQVLAVLQTAAKINNRPIPSGIDKLLHQVLSIIALLASITTVY